MAQGVGVEDGLKEWPAARGAMADLLRGADWAATPLGPVEAWPACLRVAVGAALDARLATIVLWGEQLIQIYNDAYQPILGPRHPAALGQPTALCWPEVWAFNAPIYRQVLEGGASVYFEDQEFRINVDGAPRAHYFTLSYAPARDEAGAVRGVVVAVAETTQRVLLERENLALAAAARGAARRQGFNLALADALRAQTAPDQMIACASAMLGRELDAARVLYCEVDEARGSFEIRRDWTAGGVASVAGRTRALADFGAELIGELRAGRPLAVADIALEARAADVRAGYAGLGVRAFLAIPLLRRGSLSVVLTVHRALPHAWSAEERELAGDFLERTWAMAENAKAQAALRSERDQSQAVFDSMTEGFGLIDADWTVLRMNEAGLRIGRRTAAQVIGQNHWRVWPETLGSEIAALYERVKRSGVAGSHEYEHAFSPELRVWLEVRVYRTQGHGLAVLYRDVGDRKRAEAILLEGNRRKDEFLAMLAHELRNPLAPISAAAALLLMGSPDAERVRKSSQIIARQARHMSGLLDDLLDVSRVTQGLIELDKTVLDLKAVVADALEQARPLLEERGHRLALRLPAEAVFVLGDHARLVQVLSNLLHNAAKYTPPGGAVAVTLEARAGRAALAVADNGVGMTAALLGRVFDLFVQAARSADRAQGGLGLGLALVKSLVEVHGGSVAGSSAGPGEGSEFTVCLPRVAAPPAAPGAAPAPDGRGALRILVVDDNADAGGMLALLLETLGYAVALAPDGARALACARAERFDVCLLDIGLPDIDGYTLARRIRALHPAPAPTLIAVTGYGQRRDALASAAAGFDHHLVKPVDSERLLALLAGLHGRGGAP
ncbi:ATP-binding protein, partial [Janthinobacterium sp.]|uniref:hybrid sensor histidine kinase/response regulator n=1 Tax=Janthinobacterium sp. TaxID=1871054 RepID=UPI00293D8A16